MRGGRGGFLGFPHADAEDRAGPQDRPDAGRGQVGLPDVDAVDPGSGGAGGQRDVDAVVDDQRRVLAARGGGERVGDGEHLGEESPAVGVFGADLHRPHPGGDRRGDGVGDAASGRGALVGVGDQVDRPAIRVPGACGVPGWGGAHAAMTIRAASARSPGWSAASSSRKNAANVPGPPARAAARSEATA